MMCWIGIFFFLSMYRTIEITKITGQDEKSAKSEEPKTMVCTVHCSFFELLYKYLCIHVVTLLFYNVGISNQIYFFPSCFIYRWISFWVGIMFNKLWLTANRVHLLFKLLYLPLRPIRKLNPNQLFLRYNYKQQKPIKKNQNLVIGLFMWYM